MSTKRATHLSLVEGGSLDLSLFLETVNNISVRPSDFVRQSLETTKHISSVQAKARDEGTHLDRAELSSRLQSENSEGGGDDHLLLSVVRRGHTLEELESLKGGGSSGSLRQQRTINLPSSLLLIRVENLPCGEPYLGWPCRGYGKALGDGRDRTFSG